jgi:alkylation response protein AidB-like acyl-CoA dehydrogenase
MDFDLSDDQKLLVDTVRSFCAKESSVERLRKMRDDEIGWEKSTWQQMGELGWLGVIFPEEVGGLGGSFQDLGLIIEQLGTTLVPEPIIASVVLGGITLLKAGNSDQHEKWLTPMLEGETSLALAYIEEQSRFNATDVTTTAAKSGDGYKLNGKKRFVLNGHAADQIIVSARTSGESRDRDGVSLFILDKETPGLTIKKIQTMDGHKAAMIALDGVDVSADRLLGAAGEAADVLEAALDYGAAATCCEGSGIMQSSLMMTRNYLCEREQFGAKIGSFQALQHRTVDMFVETELCKATAILAMVKVDDDDAVERQKGVSSAKVQLFSGGDFVVKQATQLHGGIGVTDEHDIGLYFKRMHTLNTLFGDCDYHTERYATLPTFTKNLRERAAD